MNTAYFGNIQWFCRLLHEGFDSIDNTERWQKQTERNRCEIATANGVQRLSIPVSSPSLSSSLLLTSDIIISGHGNWQHQHWNAIASAYGMSPYFDYYADDLQPFFQPEWIGRPLVEYNEAITRTVLKLMGIADVPIILPHATTTLTLSDNPTGTYYQTFQKRHGFIPNLSVLDLLLNMGPESVKYFIR